MCKMCPKRATCTLKSIFLTGSTNQIIIIISLPAYHSVSGHFVPSWEQHFCFHVLVPPLRGYLWFIIQLRECLSILQFVLIWIILQGLLCTQVNQVTLPCARTQCLVYGLDEQATFILTLFLFPLIFGQCLVRQPMKDLTVFLFNF